MPVTDDGHSSTSSTCTARHGEGANKPWTAMAMRRYSGAGAAAVAAKFLMGLGEIDETAMLLLRGAFARECCICTSGLGLDAVMESEWKSFHNAFLF